MSPKKIIRMKRNPQKSRLIKMHWDWCTEKKSYAEAREIWIFCIENELSVPSEVLNVFKEGVRKEQESYELNHPNRRLLGRIGVGHLAEKKAEKSHQDYLLYRFIRLWMSGGKTQTSGIERYCQIIDKRGGEISFDAAKQRIARAVKYGKAVDQSWEDMKQRSGEVEERLKKMDEIIGLPRIIS